MARHARITESLNELRGEAVIEGWTKDAHRTDARWVVQTNDGQAHYLTSREVEAFALGAQAALRAGA